MKSTETTGETPAWRHANDHGVARKLKRIVAHPFTFIVLVWMLLFAAFYLATEFL
ncbi:MAG TPA: hypothetical protein VFZ34_22415 [Blastocatellia bacterium]|nr:hypothetical protein [Blastocatellia bacterium]